MADGFIFNRNMCVGCRACVAACTLENGWPFQARNVYTSDSLVIQGFPLVNISMACNHCEKALCLDGCPSAAYFRDPETGAVLIDDRKCIGCRYCQWNCPYDAPRFIVSTQVIGKCNLCYTLLHQEMQPACSTACPTGALKYGAIGNESNAGSLKWLPGRELKPALELKGKDNSPLRISPQHLFMKGPDMKPDTIINISREWSLIAFTFLTILSVAKTFSALVIGTFPERSRFIALILLAGVLSIFHLGRKVRAWRAVVNIKNSPLSREIVLFIIYALLAGTAVASRLPVMLVISAVAGLALVLAIDSVYIFADKRPEVFFRSGQAFITLLLIVSFLSGKIVPFVFVAILKLAASVYSMKINRNDSRRDSMNFGIRYMRVALLFVSGASLVSGISYPGYPVLAVFLTGEIIDRLLFYMDFSPLNINNIITNNTI